MEAECDGDVMLLRLADELAEASVGEVYSPPRVTARAELLGIKGNFAMDRQTKDEKGESWDFDVMAMRDKAEAVLRQKKQKLLIGSPMCTHMSIIMNLNRERMGEEQYKAKVSYAVRHLEFMCHLYRVQLSMG